MQFKPEDNYDGPATLSIETNDLGHCGTGGPQTTTERRVDRRDRRQRSAREYVPPAQNAFTQYPLTFSDAAGNAIRITDPDAGDNPVQVTLSVDQGTLTLGSTDGLAFFTGNGTATITIQDTMADINAALDGMQFQARSNFEGMAYLRSPPTTWATAASAAPRRRPTPSPSTRRWSLRPRSPRRVLRASMSISRSSSRKPAATRFRISDPFVGNLPVQVTLSADFGTLSLSGVKGLTFAPGSGPSGAAMTFTGTIANINAALEGMKFTPTDSNSTRRPQIHIPSTTSRLGYTGAHTSPQIAGKTVSVGLVAVNDPPVITMPQLSGSDPMRITFSSANGNAIRVSDPDIGNNPADMTIMTNDSTFTLATTDGLKILGGSPIAKHVYQGLRHTRQPSTTPWTDCT